MKGNTYNELIDKVEEFPLEEKQIQQVLEIEEILRKLGFFWQLHRFLKSFRSELQVWKRALERVGIPREIRNYIALGATLATAYERNKEKRKEDKNGKGREKKKREV